MKQNIYVEKLENKNNSKNEDFFNELCEYCKCNNLNKIKKLPIHKINLLEKNEDGDTPLHIACEYGYLDIVKFIVSCGGKTLYKIIHKQNTYNVLHSACIGIGASIDVVKYLIEDLKIDPNIKDYEYANPLHCAVTGGHLDIVAYLVEVCKVEIDSKDNYGNTILHNCCMWGYLDIMKYIIGCGKHNININTKNKNGETILFEACYWNKIDMINYILKECDVDSDEVKNMYIKSLNSFKPEVQKILEEWIYNRNLTITKKAL